MKLKIEITIAESDTAADISSALRDVAAEFTLGYAKGLAGESGAVSNNGGHRIGDWNIAE